MIRAAGEDCFLEPRIKRTRARNVFARRPFLHRRMASEVSASPATRTQIGKMDLRRAAISLATQRCCSYSFMSAREDAGARASSRLRLVGHLDVIHSSSQRSAGILAASTWQIRKSVSPPSGKRKNFADANFNGLATILARSSSLANAIRNVPSSPQ